MSEGPWGSVSLYHSSRIVELVIVVWGRVAVSVRIEISVGSSLKFEVTCAIQIPGTISLQFVEDMRMMKDGVNELLTKTTWFRVLKFNVN